MYKISAEEILDFKPKDYVKTIYATEEVIQESVYTPSTITNIISQTSISTITSAISNLINDIYKAKSSIETQSLTSELDILKSSLTSNKVLNGDIMKYINYHCTDISGDVKVEIYYALHNLQNEISTFNDVIKKIVYGDSNISDEDASKIDSDKLESLNYLESNKIDTINYASLNTDAKINSLLTAYSNSVSSYGNGLISLIDATPSNTILDTNLKNSTLNIFNNEVNNSSKCMDLHNSYVDTNVVSYAIIDVYNKRAGVLGNVKTYDGIMKLDDCNLIGQYMKDYYGNIDTLNTSIIELSKSIIYNAVSKGDYADSIINKNNLRNLYNLNFKTTK